MNSLQSAIAAIFLIISIILLWKVDDVLFIKNEFRGFAVVALPLYIVWCGLTFREVGGAYVPLGIVLVIILYSHTTAITFPVIFTYTRALNATEGRRVSFLDHQPPTVSVDSGDVEAKPLSTAMQETDPMVLALSNPILLSSFEKFCVKALCVEV